MGWEVLTGHLLENFVVLVAHVSAGGLAGLSPTLGMVPRYRTAEEPVVQMWKSRIYLEWIHLELKRRSTTGGLNKAGGCGRRHPYENTQLHTVVTSRHRA